MLIASKTTLFNNPAYRRHGYSNTKVLPYSKDNDLRSIHHDKNIMSLLLEVARGLGRNETSFNPELGVAGSDWRRIKYMSRAV